MMEEEGQQVVSVCGVVVCVMFLCIHNFVEKIRLNVEYWAFALLFFSHFINNATQQKLNKTTKQAKHPISLLSFEILQQPPLEHSL
jgi:hypothetical protein